MDKEMNPRRNLAAQASKILRDVLNAYEVGLLDDPKHCATFGTLLALICEGKIKGNIDEVSGKVFWALTPEYSSSLESSLNNLRPL